MIDGPRQFIPTPAKRNFFPESGELTEQEKELSEILVEKVEKKRISSSRFIRVFGGDNVRDDEAEVRDRKTRFARKDKSRVGLSNEATAERGIISERAIIFGMQEGKWFGEGAKVKMASEYDDYVNGVDCIVELDSTKQLAIGIDTTISAYNITDKLQRIRDKILGGELSEVRYFTNENYTGVLHNAPLTIIGVSLEANSSLAGHVYAMAKKESDTSKKEQAQVEISKHLIQFIILFEIKMQLEFFIQFILKYQEKFKDKPEEKLMMSADILLRKLKEELEKIREVIAAKAPKEKTEREKLVAEVKNDPVFKMIKHTLQTEFTQSDFTIRKPKELPKIEVAKIKH